MDSIKTIFIREVSKIFSCKISMTAFGIRKAIFFTVGYILLMLITFGIASLAALEGSPGFTSLFSFFLGIEIFIFQLIVGFVTFMVFIYYGAIGAKRGWNRF